jgi:hypothetical protein
MDMKPSTDRMGSSRPQRQPVVLTLGQTQQVSGGLNPQPLPPGAVELRLEEKN